MQKRTGIRIFPSVITIKGFQWKRFSCQYFETSSSLVLQKSVALGYKITIKFRNVCFEMIGRACNISASKTVSLLSQDTLICRWQVVNTAQLCIYFF